MEKGKYTITKHSILPCNWINSGTLRNCHKILASSLKLLLTFRALTCRAAKESPFSLCWTLNTVPKVPLLTIKKHLVWSYNIYQLGFFRYLCRKEKSRISDMSQCSKFCKKGAIIWDYCSIFLTEMKWFAEWTKKNWTELCKQTTDNLNFILLKCIIAIYFHFSPIK